MEPGYYKPYTAGVNNTESITTSAHAEWNLHEANHDGNTTGRYGFTSFHNYYPTYTGQPTHTTNKRSQAADHNGCALPSNYSIPERISKSKSTSTRERLQWRS
jgi:hypothetical protein